MSAGSIEEIKDLTESYISWLKNKTILRKVNDGWVEIETPYVDRHNDFVAIYVRKNGSYFELTDGGYVLEDLSMSGCSFSSPKKKMLLLQTLRNFGAELTDNGMIFTNADKDNFPVKKHSLIQAIITVNDMFFSKTPQIERLFVDVVSEWLDKNKVRYSPNIKIIGKTGYDQLFNFVIPKSEQYPERFVQTVNEPQKSSIQDVMFRWEDVKGARAGALLFVILNDTASNVSDSILSALRNYNARPFMWGHINNYLFDFVA